MGPLAKDTNLDLVIGLPLRNTDALNKMLQQVYDPSSPNYHQWLTPSQFNATYAPSEQDYQALMDFAKANQMTIVTRHANRSLLHVRMPVANVEKIFHVTMNLYQHPSENRLFFSPDREPSMDASVPISYISGLNNFIVPHTPLRDLPVTPHNPTPNAGSGSNGWFTGTDFRAAYAPDVSETGKGQVVGIIQFAGYYPADIQAYETNAGFPNVPIQNVFLSGYTGTPDSGDALGNEESSMDIELAISMAPGLSKVVVYGAPSDASCVELLDEIANPTQGEPLPNQISTSFYFYYDDNVYKALKQLAVQGQALFVASGDYGSYDEATGSGAFPPADHPLVTCVGGTDLSTTGPGGSWQSEVTWPFSGGGYSPWGGNPEFAIPIWQSGINMSSIQGSTTVRNCPDVAMVANNLWIRCANGTWEWSGGTSAAAPLWAGFAALANQHAAASGRTRIGFFNPALYAIGKGANYSKCFHDITSGHNFNSTNPNKYSAAVGYDLCTGWGTPNGTSLIEALSHYGAPTWSLLPGGGTTKLRDTAAVYNNRLYLFAVGIDDHRHYVNSFEGQNWSGWSALPSDGTTELADTAVVFQNRLCLFSIGIKDHHHYLDSFDGQNWSGWSAIPGGGTTQIADAAVTYKNRLYLFSIGTNDHHHYVNSFDGQNWSGWKALPGTGTTNLADTAAVLNDRLYLFAIGTNDHHHYTNSFDGQKWAGWSALPGGGTTELPDAAITFGNSLYLFAIGTNDHHHYVNSFDGQNWAGWSVIANGSTTELPDAAVAFQNHLLLFGIGISDHQHYVLQFR